jgi:hypothetical protein
MRVFDPGDMMEGPVACAAVGARWRVEFAFDWPQQSGSVMQRVPFRRFIDPRRVNNFLDTCAFDPKYSPEDLAAQRIRALHHSGEIQLLLAHSIQKEVDHPNTPAEVKREAAEMIFTLPVTLTNPEIDRKARIHGLLTGHGKPEKYLADASHIFEAGKYGGYFITTDARILRKRDDLRAICAPTIVRPSEWLELLESVP